MIVHHTIPDNGLERLELLADHLERGELGHKVFDFSIFNNVETPSCGTAGCAVGELPVIFPKHWEFSSRGAPLLRNFWSLWVTFHVADFFGIETWEADHLFLPACQRPELGGVPLSKTATAAEVAANMREFIKLKRA